MNHVKIPSSFFLLMAILVGGLEMLKLFANNLHTVVSQPVFNLVLVCIYLFTPFLIGMVGAHYKNSDTSSQKIFSILLGIIAAVKASFAVIAFSSGNLTMTSTIFLSLTGEIIITFCIVASGILIKTKLMRKSLALQ